MICASPVISLFMRTWNDDLDSDPRLQDLKRYAPRLVGTVASAEIEHRRCWMISGWLAKVYAPAWLRLAGFGDQADRLADLPEFTASMDVKDATGVMAQVRQVVFTARKSQNIGRRIARDAQGVVSITAGYAAFHVGCYHARFDRVPGASTLRVTTWHVAWDAVMLATAAGVTPGPTCDQLIGSAYELVDRLIAIRD